MLKSEDFMGQGPAPVDRGLREPGQCGQGQQQVQAPVDHLGRARCTRWHIWGQKSAIGVGQEPPGPCPSKVGQLGVVMGGPALQMVTRDRLEILC